MASPDEACYSVVEAFCAILVVEDSEVDACCGWRWGKGGENGGCGVVAAVVDWIGRIAVDEVDTHGASEHEEVFVIVAAWRTA